MEGLGQYALFIEHGGIKEECYRVLLCPFAPMQQAANQGQRLNVSQPTTDYAITSGQVGPKSEPGH